MEQLRDRWGEISKTLYGIYKARVRYRKEGFMIKLTMSYNDLQEKRKLLEGLKGILVIQSVSKEYERKSHKEVYVKGELKA